MAIQYYTLEEAARLLNVSPDELKLMSRRGKPRPFKDGGTFQFRVSEIDEMARERGARIPMWSFAVSMDRPSNDLPKGNGPPPKKRHCRRRPVPPSVNPMPRPGLPRRVLLILIWPRKTWI